MIQKESIRTELLIKRRNLSKNFVESASKLISERFIDNFCVDDFKNVMLYSDFDNEPQTHELARLFLENGCKVAYPLICGNDIIPKIPGKPMLTNNFGIREPSIDDVEIPAIALDMIIVPGVCFDINKNRIGYGKGYYDRLLKSTNALKVALAYSFQIINDSFKTYDSDIPVDVIVTEREIIT